MLGSLNWWKWWVSFSSPNKLKHVVLDPIIRSSSGAPLLDAKGIQSLVKNFVAACRSDHSQRGRGRGDDRVQGHESGRDEKSQPNKLHELGAKNVVITGGHLEKAVDLLSMSNGKGSATQEEVRLGAHQVDFNPWRGHSPF